MVVFNLMLQTDARKKRFLKNKSKELINKKYHTSGYERISFGWIPVKELHKPQLGKTGQLF